MPVFSAVLQLSLAFIMPYCLSLTGSDRVVLG
nr:MAG TPA: hypothetical protein [Caudoviricetes sp.]